MYSKKEYDHIFRFNWWISPTRIINKNDKEFIKWL